VPIERVELQLRQLSALLPQYNAGEPIRFVASNVGSDFAFATTCLMWLEEDGWTCAAATATYHVQPIKLSQVLWSFAFHESAYQFALDNGQRPRLGGNVERDRGDSRGQA
jgi:hypothetical protein